MIDFGHVLSGQIHPAEPLICGKMATVQLLLTVQTGLEPGARVRLYFTQSPYYREEPMHGLPAKGFVFYARVHFQCHDPQAAGYLTAQAESGRKLDLEVSAGRCYVDVYSPQGLPAHDTLHIVFGDRSLGGPGMEVVQHPTYGPWHLICELDAQGDGHFQRQIEMPAIQVKPDVPSQLLVRSPSHIQPGEGVALQMVVVDRFGNHVEGYGGELSLQSQEARRSASATTALAAEQDGIVRLVSDTLSEREGIHRAHIQLTGDDGRLFQGQSNPVLCKSQTEPFALYWGDIHGHSFVSDGTHSPRFYYGYGRHAGNLDFCALTDHNTFPPELWPELIAACEEANVPDRYTTFLGYEWNGAPPQSIVVYFKEAAASVYLGSRSAEQSAEEFIADLAGQELLLARHDMPPLGSRWTGLDPSGKLERLVEIYSSFHTSEAPDAPHPRGSLDRDNSIQAALASGLRFGFLGCSDSHLSMPGRRLGASKGYPGYRPRAYGLTAVYAGANTRDDIFAALRARRCYAATDRILLDFQINGCAMGGTVSGDGPRTIHVLAAGTALLAQVDLIRNNEVIHQTGREGWETEFDYVDDESVPTGSYYYVRVVQEDGGMAWASPIWIEPEHELGN